MKNKHYNKNASHHKQLACRMVYWVNFWVRFLFRCSGVPTIPASAHCCIATSSIVIWPRPACSSSSLLDLQQREDIKRTCVYSEVIWRLRAH